VLLRTDEPPPPDSGRASGKVPAGFGTIHRPLAVPDLTWSLLCPLSSEHCFKNRYYWRFLRSRVYFVLLGRHCLDTLGRLG